MHRGQLDPALEEFEKAGETGEKSAAIASFIGNVYLAKRLWSRAEQSFENALALDADHAAVRIRYEQPAAHYQLGVAMARMGHHARAATALAALSLAPEMKRIRRYLSQVRARIYRLPIEPRPQRAEPVPAACG
jgi:tetratricopeptide (TPR) repeat protein